MKVRIVPALAQHAALVAANMHESSRAEILAGWGKEPPEAIRECFAASQYARTVFYGLEVLAVYGLADERILGRSAEVWCFGTVAIDRHGFAFARASRKVVAELLCRAPMLTNLVDVDDERALRWLQFLHAQYPLPPQERGGKRFRQFILAEEAQCQQG